MDIDPVPRRRPPDRKDQILEHASTLFLARGFPAVTMEDIAEAAGVTARALYRHYENKSSLLAAVITTSQEHYLTVRADAGLAGPDRHRGLSAELPALVEVALRTRRLTMLWQREARYLPDASRREVRGRLTTIVDGIRAAIAVEFPALDPLRTEVRAWGVSSTLTSLGLHELDLPGADLHALLADACRAAAHAPPGTLGPPRHRGASAVEASRREQLLAAGAHAFARQGFLPVGITEVARRAGIAGPGIYRYFESKQSILDALARRLDEWHALEHLRALAHGAGRREVLHHLVRGHVRISTEHPDLVALSITETGHLSDEVRDLVARGLADRIGTWVDCLRTCRSALSRTEARILVHAARTYIDDVARTPRLWQRGDVADEIAMVATAILDPR